MGKGNALICQATYISSIDCVAYATQSQVTQLPTMLSMLVIDRCSYCVTHISFPTYACPMIYATKCPQLLYARAILEQFQQSYLPNMLFFITAGKIFDLPKNALQILCSLVMWSQARLLSMKSRVRFPVRGKYYWVFPQEFFRIWIATYDMGLKHNWRNEGVVSGTPLSYPSGMKGMVLCYAFLIMYQETIGRDSNSTNVNAASNAFGVRGSPRKFYKPMICGRTLLQGVFYL